MIQFNAGRGSIATSEIVEYARAAGHDLLLLQEPYVYNNKIPCGYGRIFYGGDRGQPIRAAAVVLNEKFSAIMRGELTTNDCVCIRVDQNGSAPCNMVSVYSRPAGDFGIDMRSLERVLLFCQGEQIVIGGDFNAKSGLWYSNVLDERGSLLEDMAMAHNLTIINEPSELTTFEDSRGRGTNIDVTLTTRRIRVSAPWRVQDDCHSDHRRVLFSVIVDGMPERNPDQLAVNKESYDLKKANWPALVRAIRNSLESTDWASLRANDKAGALQDILRRACDEQIPRRGSNKRNNKEWWSPELSRLRRSVKRKREKCLRTRDEQDRNMFTMARNRYRTATRAAKRAAWLKQIEKAELEDPWGKVYKIVRGKLSPPLMLTTLRKDDGTYTSDERETLDFFLERMLPDDQVNLNDLEEMRLRGNMMMFGEDVEEDFTMGELDDAVKKIKNKKAPGPDGLKGEVIKAIFPVIKEVLLRILNEVWRLGHFPEVWKDGEVKIFLKGPEKPVDEVKSYRPITLLPVLGKVYERLIVGRIWRAINERELMLPFQHGFREGRGTVTAFEQLARVLDETEERWLVGIFADISGAFDNAWWPLILDKMKNWGMSGNLLRVVSCYLQDRTVTLRTANCVTSKKLTKGCPQGSVLGPVLWDVLFESLLVRDFGPGSGIIAYADDALITVKGNTRAQVERALSVALGEVCDWAKTSKMTISVEKTVVMTIAEKVPNRGRRGGQRDAIRQMVARCPDMRAANARSVRYLGVTIEERMNFGLHFEKTSARVLAELAKLERISRANSGWSIGMTRKLYRSVIEPIMLYGCEFWGVDLEGNETKKKKRWLSLQRKVLIKTIKAYRTVSYEAMWVVSGFPPLDLKIAERRGIREDRARGIDKKVSALNRENNMIDEWQNRWSVSTKGRTSWSFCDDVRLRVKTDWELNYYVVQFLTGHGNFNAKLHGFGLVDSPRCLACGEIEETSEHVLWACPHFERERMTYREALGIVEDPLDLRSEMNKERNRKELFRLMTSVGKRKEAEERERRLNINMD